METQETSYLWWMAASVIVSFGLFGTLGLKGEKQQGKLAGLSLLLGAVLGLIGAKLVYYLCQIDFMIAAGWKESLFQLNPEEMSFFGGVAGVSFGVSLAARACGRKPMEILNRFAPYGLILAALARFGEAFLGMLGVGPYLEEEALCFFPLAKGFSYGDDWTEWYLAVFMLEGIAALILAAVSGWKLKEHRFLRSVYYLCVVQILLENLRLGSFMWFFCIRVEQLACMIAIFTVLVMYGVRSQGKKKRFLPAGISLLCAGLFIVCEFAMEGKISFLRFLNIEACYALMAAGQVILITVERKAYRGLMMQE